MRVWVLILGILGGLAAGFLGMSWLSDWNDQKDVVNAIRSVAEDAHLPLPPQFAELERHVNAAWVLLADVAVGLLGGVLAFARKPVPAGLLMLLGVAIPGVLAPQSLAFTCILALAGLLALVGKSQIEAAA